MSRNPRHPTSNPRARPAAVGSAGLLQRQCACGGSAGVSGACSDCSGQRLSRRPAAAGATDPEPVPRVVHDVLRMPGRPLEAHVAAGMAARFDRSGGVGHPAVAPPAGAPQALSLGAPDDRLELAAEDAARAVVSTPRPALAPQREAGRGHDFSQVRIHTDARAAESAQAVQALAYTVGRDVVFAAGQYAPGTPAGERLLAHELAHVVQQSGGGPAALRRYGHGNECDQKKYLEPHIWPGHDHAKKATARAIAELGNSPLHPTVKSELIRLFGPGADAQAGTIKSNFAKIQSALGDQYLYRCGDPCVKPNRGARAWTEPSGKMDITLCFDQIRSFDVPATAWIIIHENVHRALNVWPNPHPWDASGFDNCVGASGSAPGFKSVVLDNPDSYACFASRMWFPL